jgi:hypothetical protein
MQVSGSAQEEVAHHYQVKCLVCCYRFFRVLPGVLAQVGISGDPVLSDRWSAAVLQDEPVIQTNTRGTIGFTQKTGQPNSRTTMLYFNLQVSLVHG